MQLLAYLGKSIVDNVPQLNEVADKYLKNLIRRTMGNLKDKLTNEAENQPSLLGAVSGSQIQIILSPVIGLGYTNTRISVNDKKVGIVHILIFPFFSVTIYKDYR